MEQLRPASIREQRADVILKSEAALQKELAPGQPATAMDISHHQPPSYDADAAEGADHVQEIVPRRILEDR
eukprot:6390685-Amphidinium_carterae.1